MKRHSNQQEVIILGSGLGGLVAGTLLLKNNRSVILLKESGYQSYDVKKGYRFVHFSNFSEKCLKEAFVQKVSQVLNLPLLNEHQEESQHTKLDLDRSKEKATFQVILPKARVDIFSQRSLSQTEWRREFPKETARIEQYYSEMDDSFSLLKHMKSKEGPQSVFPAQERSLIKRWFFPDSLTKEGIGQKLSTFSIEFREFIRLQLIAWGNLYSDQFPVAIAANVLINDGSNDLTQNVDLGKLEEKASEQFLKFGGRIEEIDRVEKIDKEWREGFVISLGGEQGDIRSDRIILNLPLHRLTNLLGKTWKRLLKWEEKIRPRYILFPLFLGIREKVVPVGMKEFIISILDLEKPYGGGNVLFLALSPKGDETQAPEGKRALTVESLMPFEELKQESLSELRKGVMKHLQYLFPFIEDHIEFADFEWANEQFMRWSYRGFLYETTSDFHWREGVIPTRLSKNLYFTGKENFPYLGLEGEFLTGMMVAKQILGS